MSGAGKKVGIALCGFGRAGQIHFNGVRSNHRCQLRYIVDKVQQDDSIKRFIQGKLEEYMLQEQVKVVGTDCFEEVSHHHLAVLT